MFPRPDVPTTVKLGTWVVLVGPGDDDKGVQMRQLRKEKSTATFVAHGYHRVWLNLDTHASSKS